MKKNKTTILLIYLFFIICHQANMGYVLGAEQQDCASLICDLEKKGYVLREGRVDCASSKTSPDRRESELGSSSIPLEILVLDEIVKNVNVYLHSDAEIGLYFIKRNIDLLEVLNAPSCEQLPEKAWLWDQATNYGRYGQLLKQLGRPEESKPYFSKGLKASQDAGAPFTTEKEFEDHLEKLEKSLLMDMQLNPSRYSTPFPIKRKKAEAE